MNDFDYNTTHRRPIDSCGLQLHQLCYHCPRPLRYRRTRCWLHYFGSPLVSFCFAYVVFSLPSLSCRACSSWWRASAVWLSRTFKESILREMKNGGPGLALVTRSSLRGGAAGGVIQHMKFYIHLRTLNGHYIFGCPAMDMICNLSIPYYSI